MSANENPTSSSGNLTRKQRRAADRAARKNSGGKPSSSGSGRNSGPSMLVVSVGAIAIGLVAVVALVLVSGGIGGDSDSGSGAVSEPDTPAPAMALRDGRSLGETGAPVSVDVFEDPQCPACGAFTKRIEPLLVGSYVSDGTATLKYNDFVFLGDESWDAAIAMRVAEDMDGKFWDYHHILFHNQSSENQGAFSRDRLADMAVIIGLDRDEFLQLMDDPAYRSAVAAETQKGSDLTVSSTPTLIVNGELTRGVPTWEDLSALIETAAANAQATEAPATEPPATEAQATELPATEAPATELPATEAQATEPPATELPAATPADGA